MPVEQSGIDAKRMSNLERVEIRFKRVPEKDCCWREEFQEVRLDIAQREGRFGELFGSDTRPSVKNVPR